MHKNDHLPKSHILRNKKEIIFINRTGKKSNENPFKEKNIINNSNSNINTLNKLRKISTQKIIMIKPQNLYSYFKNINSNDNIFKNKSLKSIVKIIKFKNNKNDINQQKRENKKETNIIFNRNKKVLKINSNDKNSLIEIKKKKLFCGKNKIINNYKLSNTLFNSGNNSFILQKFDLKYDFNKNIKNNDNNLKKNNNKIKKNLSHKFIKFKNNEENYLSNKLIKKKKLNDHKIKEQKKNNINNQFFEIKKNNIKECNIISSNEKSEEITINNNSTNNKKNNNTSNTKPSENCSFIFSNDLSENINKRNKSPIVSTNFNNHMEFINSIINQNNVFVSESISKTKENESKFLNYDLGKTNGLSQIHDSLLFSFDIPYFNKEKYHEKNNNLIEQEQTEEEIYKVAHKILDSNNKLPEIHINKNVKDSYTELNNVSDFDELKEGEDINRIINLPIKYKK